MTIQNDISAQLDSFKKIVAEPSKQLDNYLKEGKKAIGIFPYYAPEELVHAAGFVPFGLWGASGTVREAGRYFPAFYCTIARMGLELALAGTFDRLSGVVMPTLCDTLRPLSQNFKSAKPNIPMLFLAQPQNRNTEFGVDYYVSELNRIRAELETIKGSEISDAAIIESISVYNENRAERRRFVTLSGSRPEAISASARSAVLKSAYFMEKNAHTASIKKLNDLLETLPEGESENFIPVVTSGILADSSALLRIFEAHKFSIAADDVAQESRSFRVDVDDSAAADHPIRALAKQFATQTDDSLLWEADLNHRKTHLLNLVTNNGAKGVVFIMMQFCDPEELDYPHLKEALDEAGIPSIQIGYDQQMTDFGQAETQLQTFAEILS